MRRGCLWNSFLMVGRVQAFLQSLIRSALPVLFRNPSLPFDRHYFRESEPEAVARLYEGLPHTDFSHAVLLCAELATSPSFRARGSAGAIWESPNEFFRRAQTQWLPRRFRIYFSLEAAE